MYLCLNKNSPNHSYKLLKTKTVAMLEKIISKIDAAKQYDNRRRKWPISK